MMKKAGKRSDGKPKFRIFENRLNPDESYCECMLCGNKALFSEEVEMVIRAPRKESDLVKDL